MVNMVGAVRIRATAGALRRLAVIVLVLIVRSRAVIASVRRVFSTWWSSDGGFPPVRQQLVDLTVQLRRQSREDVLEVGPGVVPVQLGRLQQARDDGSAFAGQLAPHKKPVPASEAPRPHLVFAEVMPPARTCRVEVAF
jgi:hypothetical protein